MSNKDVVTSEYSLLFGDCLERMKEIPDGSVDLTVTSPPYFNAREYSQYDSYADYLHFLKKVFETVLMLTKSGRLCAVNISTVIEPRLNRNSESKRIAIPFHFVCLMESLGWKFLEDIIWVKPEGSAKNRNGSFFQHRKPVAYKPNIVNEYIFIFQKPCGFLIDKILRQYDKKDNGASLILGDYERSNVWKINPETKMSGKHSAPFPLELPKKLISYYSFEKDVIFDPFLGSGSTGVAAKNLNRSFIGVEMDDNYFNIAKDRIAKALN